MSNDPSPKPGEGPGSKKRKAVIDLTPLEMIMPYLTNGNADELEQHMTTSGIVDHAALLQFLTDGAKSMKLGLWGVDLTDDDNHERICASLRDLIDGDVDSRLHGETFGIKNIGVPDHPVNKDLADLSKVGTARLNVPLPTVLVLGSSGSGKTTFAAKILPDILKERDPPSKRFTVCMRGGDVREGGDVVTTTKAMAALAKKEIVRLIKEESGIDIDIAGASLCKTTIMTVIIDEIGLNVDKSFVGTGAELLRITQTLQELGPTVQLVLAGTGLDRITSSVNSDQDAVKIRMKPWSVDQVVWLVDHISTDRKKEEIATMIRETPIFCKLGTNARAARFLLRALVKYGDYFEKTALIDAVVTEVAFNYIRANGLKDLDAKQRRKVAKIVLGAVQNAEKGNADNAELPTEEDSRVESACNSLLDTHVEGGKLAHKEHFAVSVTPAITIVLTALMGNISNLSSSWSGFENIVALAELQRLFVASTEEDGPPSLSLRRSRVPFPAPKTTVKVKVPKLALHSILVNGAGAPYADVISHFRFFQCKYTADLTDKGLVKLNLKVELAKMGVLKAEHYRQLPNGSEKYRVQRFLTNRLMKQWKELHVEGGGSAEEARNTERHVSEKTKSSPKDGNTQHNLIPIGGVRSMYPMGLLDVPDRLDEIVFEEYKLADGTFTDKDGQTINWEGAFQDEITIVFATNKGGFFLDGLLEKNTCDVRRQHLDGKGEIVGVGEGMSSYITGFLEELVDVKKVHIRFQVCSL
jgi:hypothetical protein